MDWKQTFGITSHYSPEPCCQSGHHFWNQAQCRGGISINFPRAWKPGWRIRIKLKPDAKPYALSTPPSHCDHESRKSSTRSQSIGVISKVDEPTPWCAGMVVLRRVELSESVSTSSLWIRVSSANICWRQGRTGKADHTQPVRPGGRCKDLRWRFQSWTWSCLAAKECVHVWWQRHERRYVQIEKAALATTCACDKFTNYMLNTDKPGQTSPAAYAVQLRDSLEEAYCCVRKNKGTQLEKQKQLYDEKIRGKAKYMAKPSNKANWSGYTRAWFHQMSIHLQKVSPSMDRTMESLIWCDMQHRTRRRQRLVVHFNCLKPVTPVTRFETSNLGPTSGEPVELSGLHDDPSMPYQAIEIDEDQQHPAHAIQPRPYPTRQCKASDRLQPHTTHWVNQGHSYSCLCYSRQFFGKCWKIFWHNYLRPSTAWYMSVVLVWPLLSLVLCFQPEYS